MIFRRNGVVYLVFALYFLGVLFTFGNGDRGKIDHGTRIASKKIKRSASENPLKQEDTVEFWHKIGEQALKERLDRRVMNENVARNVILFLGDGMSIATISAARAYLGGEEMELSFDKFPYTGLSKTYCVDKQVADSACSATAYLGGVKANDGTIGVTSLVDRKNCEQMTNSSNFVYSLAHLFQNKGKKTGLVTTSRVTHASPAGIYAHTSERDWETDKAVRKAKMDPGMCSDIASQMVFGDTGRRLNVVMGGGLSNFIPESERDVYGKKGKREDGQNLISKWLFQKIDARRKAEFVSSRNQLLNLNYDRTDDVLGLFCSSHCPFNLERNATLVPSLEEMTEAAIKLLSRNGDGYFLFVEGARIDMGHHRSQAFKALDETVEFSKAVQKAVDLTDDKDTLIVVTSDHSHTMSYSGYAQRGEDILGIAGKGADGLPYTILSYANGPGYHKADDGGGRHDIRKDDMNDIEYHYPSMVPMGKETHGGEDVAIFAKGPWAHLFTGVMEENVIPHLISFASCVNTNNITNVCDRLKETLRYEKN